MSRTITPQELDNAMRSDRPPLLLDVRRSSDFEPDRALLPGAERRDPEKVADWATIVLCDREIVIYCARGGSVSNSVLDSLLACGFSARYVEGGMEAWRAREGETR